MVQRDFAKLVHQNRRARQCTHQMIQHRGFAATEKAGEQGDREGGVERHVIGYVEAEENRREAEINIPALCLAMEGLEVRSQVYVVLKKINTATTYNH